MVAELPAQLTERLDDFASQRAGRFRGRCQQSAVERSAPRDPQPQCKQNEVDVEAIAVGPDERGRPSVFLADIGEGQKTGWFFDQRENRASVARLAGGARVLDLYCYTGGFALQAAAGGAAAVLGVDRSEAALALAAPSAALNGVGPRCRFERGEVFGMLETLHGRGERFDIVIADPPAFVKSKKELHQGERGYRKLARLAAALVKPGGFLFIASCWHNVTPEDFAEGVRRGLADAERTGRVLLSSGATPDHPVHPALPESAYLKAQVLAID